MDDSTRGRSPQRRLQGGYGDREWSPRERGTRYTTAGFSPRRLDSEGQREPRFAEERQPRRGVRFLSPSRRSPSSSPHGEERGKLPVAGHRDPDSSVATTGSKMTNSAAATPNPHGGLLLGG